MRGDSLRDLYAKTLALVGLGLLAGAGAVVDYWPVRGPLPEVAGAPLPVPDTPRLAERLDVEIAKPVRPRPVFRLPVIPASNLGTADFLPGPPSFLDVAGVSETPDDVPAPPPDVRLSVGAMPITGLLWHEDRPVIVLAAAPVPVEPSGFLSGALRRTKDSIVRTGVAAGSGIADAFRGVYGAFKKVSPF